jgi:hypothetical protein
MGGDMKDSGKMASSMERGSTICLMALCISDFGRRGNGKSGLKMMKKLNLLKKSNWKEFRQNDLYLDIYSLIVLKTKKG